MQKNPRLLLQKFIFTLIIYIVVTVYLSHSNTIITSLFFFQGIRSQSQSFAILCLQQLSTGWLQLNLSSSSVISANTQESCPTNLCTSQEAITFTSNDSLLAFDVLSKVPVLEHSLLMRFRTRYLILLFLQLFPILFSFTYNIVCLSLSNLIENSAIYLL